MNLKKIKVAAVSYLNTKPLLYGIKQSEEIKRKINLIEDYPSNIAAMLINKSVDVGLVPIAVIPKLKEWHIISDYCIGATGDVGSVCLFSKVPLNEIERVLLDYQSQTSSALCKLLLKKYWRITPIIEQTTQEFIHCIEGKTAGVIIGDRALEQRKKSKYIYDLAGTWKAMTGLPFVFAAWIANKQLPEDFISLFNKLNAVGINNIDAVLQGTAFNDYDLKKYFTENISYRLDVEKKRGINLFLEL